MPALAPAESGLLAWRGASVYLRLKTLSVMIVRPEVVGIVAGTREELGVE